MADVLTQAQIDEMLKSVAMGADPVVTTTEETKVKEYDFRAPKKFTKEQIKILESISRTTRGFFHRILRAS